MACRDVVGFGYGIRYEYGMFRQEIADGWQVEQPDDWLTHSNVWELQRPEPAFTIGFGGHVEHRDNRAIWHPAESIIAVAHDLLVPGHHNATVNTLRLWGARPVSGLDLGKFNRGKYLEAIAPKIRSKTVTRLLYPDDSTPEGRELRLRQEHFFASASVQDLARPLPARPRRRLGPAARQGRHPPQRHASRTGTRRADAPAGRRAPAAVGAGAGADHAPRSATPTTR